MVCFKAEQPGIELGADKNFVVIVQQSSFSADDSLEKMPLIDASEFVPGNDNYENGDTVSNAALFDILFFQDASATLEDDALNFEYRALATRLLEAGAPQDQTYTGLPGIRSNKSLKISLEGQRGNLRWHPSRVHRQKFQDGDIDNSPIAQTSIDLFCQPPYGVDVE